MNDQKKYPYIYTSSQLGKFFGITIKGIEYYEKKNLIAPQRVGNNKQRKFDLAETYRLFMARYLKQAGLELNETLKFLNSTNENIVLQKYANLIQKLKSQELKNHTIIEILEHNYKMLSQIQKNGTFFKIEPRPVFDRLFLREMNGPHLSNYDQTNEYRQWNELMPITNASIRYKQLELENTSNFIEPEIGMVIEQRNFKKFNLKTSSRISLLTSVLCLHTVLTGNAQKIETKEWLEPAQNYMQKHKLKLTGDVITSLLLVLDNKSKNIRYDEAWFPIQSKYSS